MALLRRRSDRRTQPRVELLAERVRWLDRYRRSLAIGIAIVVALIFRDSYISQLDTEWPRFHMTMMSAMFGCIVWLVAEVGLAYVTALWETEEYRLSRERGLPRATLLPPRAK